VSLTGPYSATVRNIKGGAK